MFCCYKVMFIRLLLCSTYLMKTLALTTQQIPDLQFNALYSFYNSTSGDTWKCSSTRPKWNFTKNASGAFAYNPCSTISSSGSATSWQGLTYSSSPQQCSSQICHITSISLSSCGLAGTLPSHIGDLLSLRRFSLNNNLLSGTIPSKIEKLTSLTLLDFWTNLISGTITSEIINLVRLKYLDIGINFVTGSIPDDIGKLRLLNRLYFEKNALTKSIPSSVKNLTQLSELFLLNNFLSGSIPNDIWNIKMLSHFLINFNYLTGSISSHIGSFTLLQYFDCQHNLLTRVIPAEIGNLYNMFMMNINNNMFTGPILNTITNLTKLQTLDIDGNLFSGSILSDISKLVKLEFFDVANNMFTGSIPYEIGHLTNLHHLHLSMNSIVSSIPPVIENLILLTFLGIADNLLFGSIPDMIGNMMALTLLNLNDNTLTGVVPTTLSNLLHLGVLFLKSNKLIGNIDNVLNFSNQTALEMIDISDNQSSGYDMHSLYSLSSLKVLALSVNCFTSEFSSNMCGAENIEVLSFNGLGDAENCEKTFKFPLSGVSLFNTIGGTVPDCVWNLKNLSVLHLTGNGLTGEIPQLPSYSKISDLSLSHNQLRGTIPENIFDVKSLDLSYNQLSGTFADDVLYALDSSLKLEVNRLSGHLPVSELKSGNVSSLNVLRGNLFSCGTVPENDVFADDYVCGSENLNDAIYFLFSILITYFVLLMACFLLMSSGFTSVESRFLYYLHSEAQRLWVYRNYFDELLSRSKPQTAHLKKITAISDNFKKTVNLFVLLLVTVLLMSVPIYSIRLSDTSDTYSTHYYTYTWFWTVAYIRGVLPAGLILISWIIMITIFFYIIFLHHARDFGIKQTTLISNDLDQSQTSEISRRQENCWDKLKLQILGIVIPYILNAVSAIVVNVLYIYSTQQSLSPSSQLAIQLSMAVFRLIYASACVPVLARGIKDEIENTSFRFQLLVVNNLIFPCVAAAFTSPSCFQGLLVPPDTVSTPYYYVDCSNASFENGECVTYVVLKFDSAPLIPPFTYNNQCASTILTSYIPVFIFGYFIQLLLDFVLPVILIHVNNIFDVKKIVLSGLFDGILWPNFWLRENEPELQNIIKKMLQKKSISLLYIEDIFCFEVLTNLIVLLSFGLCSPILACAIVFVVVVKINIRLLLLGRFTNIVTHQSDESTHYSLTELGDLYIPIFDICKRSFRVIACCSAVFVMLVCWDIATDDVGWLRSFWIPVVTISYTLLLCVVSKRMSSKQESSIILSSGDVELLQSSMVNNPVIKFTL